ncbi:hypothetical protein M3221_00390 [Domibacillus indicus]|uniref:hypothetical protein n=1 Tax=Domibacillus indicus TaxID=1437523 RepID=UPI00203D9233|nr:hypothetical protein [Domibacillus indicus]MCM3786888.1 hypothetical protein [Domibacillus indicus]
MRITVCKSVNRGPKLVKITKNNRVGWMSVGPHVSEQRIQYLASSNVVKWEAR